MLKKLIKRKDPLGVPLYLNVYDLSSMNGYLYWFGLGIYHSGVEAHGVEYAFGAHDFSSSGVFEVEPRNCPGFRFRKAIKLGTIELDPKDFREFMVQMASEYNGDTYHLMMKNCNHFCNDVSIRLTGTSIPSWVNRLAKLGTFCNCVLPDSLGSNTIRQRREIGCSRNGCGKNDCLHLIDPLAIASPKKRRLSVPSFLQPLKGRVSPRNWKGPVCADYKFQQL